MLPRLGSSKLVSRWLAVTLIASAIAIVGGGDLAWWAQLAPARVWRGEVWRLVTWLVVEPAPYGLVLLLVAIYKFGGELAPRWGERRLRRFVLHVGIAAAVGTCLLAPLSRSAMLMAHSAGWALGDALCIAWARQFPRERIRIYGMLELGGTQLIAVTLGVTALFALANGPIVMAPELLACAIAAAYPRAWLAR